MSTGSGGSQQTSTQEVTFTPSKEQQRLYDLAQPIFEAYVKKPPTLPSVPMVAPFNPTQTAGQNLALQTAREMVPYTRQVGEAGTFLLGDVLDPTSNPALQATIDAAVRPIQTSLTTDVLPQIRAGAEGAGQYGSSRQGIAEGLAIQGAQQAAGDAAAGVATAGYQSGLDAMTRALALTPQTLEGVTAPARVISGVGAERQAQTQAQLQEQYYRQMYPQIAPFLAAQEVAAIAAGLPGGTSSSTAFMPTPQVSPIQGAMGGGAIGASTGNPYLALTGALIGAGSTYL